MEKTKNLNLWLPGIGDPIEVSKLSENFQTLDGLRSLITTAQNAANSAQSAASTAQSTASSAQSTANGRAIIRTGTYTKTDSGATTMSLNVGMPPKFVVIVQATAISTAYTGENICIYLGQNSETTSRYGTRTFSVSGNTLTITGQNSTHVMAAGTYMWIAIG